jgi:hypothetical protein
VLTSHIVKSRDLVQVRTIVSDMDLNRSRRRQFHRFQMLSDLAQPCFKHSVIEPERVKYDQHRAVRWMQIAHTVDGLRLEQFEKADHPAMGVKLNVIAEIYQ